MKCPAWSISPIVSAGESGPVPVMRYKAMDERGRKHTGEIEAANATDLETRLARLGLDLITFREGKSRRTLRHGEGCAAAISSDSASTWSSS